MPRNLKFSVLITTCNLEDYIVRALDSIFAQQHNYPFDVIIADDASSDRTLELVRSCQLRYPGIIKLIVHPTKIGLSRNYLSAMEACTGEYIAMLDGDDYWTDPLKLKKQIQFLDAHPSFVLSCHRFRKYYEHENRYDEKIFPDLRPFCSDGFVVSPDVFGDWVTQTLTVVYRNGVVDFEELRSYPTFKDTHLFYCLLQKGSGYCHSFDGGVYTIRGDGHWGSQNILRRWKTDLNTIDELQKKYEDDYLTKARERFQFGIWQREYEILKLAPGLNLRRRLSLKVKMCFSNPYKHSRPSMVPAQ